MNAGNFTVVDTRFDCVKTIRTRVFDDDRGFFYESWTEAAFRALGMPPFVQDNHSWSKYGVLRGLHWQGPPTPQGKLVRCTVGKICDIVVDIRAGSSTFGKAERFDLVGAEPKSKDASGGDQTLLYVPPGFAHGFLAMSEHAEVQYRVTAPWDRAAEGTLAWDDPEIRGMWPKIEGDPILSDKDRRGMSMAQIRANSPFPIEVRA